MRRQDLSCHAMPTVAMATVHIKTNGEMECTQRQKGVISRYNPQRHDAAPHPHYKDIRENPFHLTFLWSVKQGSDGVGQGKHKAWTTPCLRREGGVHLSAAVCQHCVAIYVKGLDSGLVS